MNLVKISSTPLQKIALTCSGGGYRATTFHLGAMSYLQRLTFNGKPLLENVKLISTVSGGTITGAVYAVEKQKGKTFVEIYHLLLGKLKSLDLVKIGISQLNPGTVWHNPDKTKNLINAFAEQYDEHFTARATFAIFDEMKSHLEAVIFNSTEFDNGINFRFRNPGRSKFGNHEIPILQAAAREIKIADAIAASSAFPGGFEPMKWPDDYIYDGAENLKKLQGEHRTGLMDGGIYDNQGIDAVLLYKRDQEQPYFDLLIISDVTSPDISPFKPTKDQPKTGLRSLTVGQLIQKAKALNSRIGWFLLALMLVLIALPIIFSSTGNVWAGVSYTLGGLCGLLNLGRMVLVNLVKKKKAQLIQMLKARNSFYLQAFSHLQVESLSIRRVEPLIMDRINSLLTLMLDVFLKVVRGLNYDKLYEDGRWRGHLISNLIKELTEKGYRKKHSDQPNIDPDLPYTPSEILRGSYQNVVGANMKKVAEMASSFGTTLWFTDNDKVKDMLNLLVAAGQFTMCYNMLEYLDKIQFTKGNGFSELAAEQQREIKDVYEQCKLDWMRFKADPIFLLQEYDKLVK